MLFPTVRHCLVCEDSRPELYRKVTIVGFYGITPDVEIVVKEFNKPINQLSFLLIAEPIQAPPSTSRVAFKIVHDDGSQVIASPELSLAMDFSKRSMLSIGAGNPVFQKSGRHFFVVTADGEEVYKTSFRVELGGPDAFKA